MEPRYIHRLSHGGWASTENQPDALVALPAFLLASPFRIRFRSSRRLAFVELVAALVLNVHI